MIEQIKKYLGTDEIVKNIQEYGGRYYVTNKGRIISTYKNRITFLKFGIQSGNHLHVNLCENGKPKSIKVHQLVLLYFVGPKPRGLETRHLNGKPNDNELTNLKYGTHKENAQDNILHGVSLKGTKNGQSKITEKEVKEIRKFYLQKNITHQQLAKKYGLCRRQVGDIINRKNWGWLDD